VLTAEQMLLKTTMGSRMTGVAHDGEGEDSQSSTEAQSAAVEKRPKSWSY
jgi:hypothetical protein